MNEQKRALELLRTAAYLIELAKTKIDPKKTLNAPGRIFELDDAKAAIRKAAGAVAGTMED